MMGTLEITIRPYRDEDLGVLPALWFESWKSTGIAAAETVSVQDLRERLPREIEGGWEIHVALRQAEIAGFLALSGVKLDQLFIKPSLQGLGVGKILLDFAKARRPKGFELTTATASRAGRFYLREGLIAGETLPHPRFGHPITRYVWPGG